MHKLNFQDIVFTGIMILAAMSVPVFGESYADSDNPEEKIVPIIIDKKPPVIDGKFTSETEWSDTTVTKFYSNGYESYLLTKHDENSLYLMFDGVDFTINPHDESSSSSFQAIICFDRENDKSSIRQSGDVCIVTTQLNEFGKMVRGEFRVFEYDSNGDAIAIDSNYGAGWSFGHSNDPYQESIDHSTFEASIPKEYLDYSEIVGFSFSAFQGSAEGDDLVQLVDGVIWPPDTLRESPSTWGKLVTFDVSNNFSPLKQWKQYGLASHAIKCKENLVLIQKYDGSPACVTESTKLKLIERGWTTKDSSIEKSLLESYNDLPEVKAFYETYEDVKVSVRNDHVSYYSGSDEGYFVRMNLMFDEDHFIKDIDFHCYYQRVPQYDLPQEDTASKIVKYDCKEHGKTISMELSFEQRCADNYKLLRDKIHDLQTSLYSSSTSYVITLDNALDIKKDLYELKCQSKAIEWFYLISGNKITNPTKMQIQRTNGNVGEITNHMLLSPQNAVKMKIAAELEQREIDYTIIPVTGGQTDEGWLDPARLCSPLSFDNGTKFYASAVFHPEPLEIIGIFVDLERPDDCQKYYNLPA